MSGPTHGAIGGAADGAAHGVPDGPVMRDSLVQLIGRLRARGEHLSCAESCTGGLLSARIAAVSGVSDVYVGSVIAYANQVKTGLLGVSDSLIRQVGAVSTSVAEQMAHGVRRRLGTHWGVSITGVAGPSGGTPHKPVGTVCFAVSGPGVEWSTMMRFDGSRGAIQEQSSAYAIAVLNVALEAGLDGLNKVFGPRTGL